jgi:molybdenum cofactor cytidylyltransferase
MLTLHRALSLALDPAAPDVVAVVGGGGKSNAVFRLAKDAHAATGCRAIITHTARIARFQDGWAPAFVEAAEGAELPWPAIAAALDAHGYLLLTGPIVGDRRKGITPAQVDELARRAAELGVGLIAAEADGSKMRPVKAPDSHEPVVPASTTHLLPIIGLDAIGALIDGRGVHRPELVRAVLGLDPVAPVRLTPAHVAQLLTASAGGGKARPAAAALIPLLNKADTPLRLIYGRLTAHLLATMGYSSLVAALLNEGPPVIERWGPVATVVLAAGGSTRLGRPKAGGAGAGRADGRARRGACPCRPRLARWSPSPAPMPARRDGGAGSRRASARKSRLAPNLSLGRAGWPGSLHTALAALPPRDAGRHLPARGPALCSTRCCCGGWCRRGATARQIAAPPRWSGQLRGAPSLFDRTFFGELATVTGDRARSAAHPSRRRRRRASRSRVAAGRRPRRSGWRGIGVYVYNACLTVKRFLCKKSNGP